MSLFPVDVLSKYAEFKNIRLNVGCGSDLRENYINIDKHSRQEIEQRYQKSIPNNVVIEDYDIFDLPFIHSTVDEVLCHGFLEHLSFEEEGKFFREVDRVLKQGGMFHFTVPDFESLLRQWLDAQDIFIDFYRTDQQEHWFGNHNRNLNNRWGYLTASIFGNQNGEGQFHKNAYTKEKICSIMNRFNYKYQLYFFNFKDTDIKMIGCKAWKV